MEIIQDFSFNLFFWQFFILIYLAIWIYALVDILRHDFTQNNKLIWILAVIFVPFIGAILYFVIGRSQKIKKQ